MKHELTLHYSVRNGGDGSAYPRFMESEELAEFDQENMTEGWGESCTGSINLESDSPIIIKDEITTKESYLIDMLGYDDFGNKAAKFVKEFFPNGLPNFVVTTELSGNTEYLYNIVWVDGKKVAKEFKQNKDSGEKFESFLNGLQKKADSYVINDEDEDEDY